MGRYGVGKCVIPDDDNNPQGKFAGDRCQAVWTTDDSAACEVDQNGCPDSACDDDDKPWCVIDGGEYVYNPGWCYCEPTPKPSGKCIITDARKPVPRLVGQAVRKPKSPS